MADDPIPLLPLITMSDAVDLFKARKGLINLTRATDQMNLTDTAKLQRKTILALNIQLIESEILNLLKEIRVQLK